MFHKTEDFKGNFLQHTKAAREERALEKKRENAAIIIQANVRRFLCRTKFTNALLEEFDSKIPEVPEDLAKVQYEPAIEIYSQTLRLLLIWNKDRDKCRFAKLCQYLVATLPNDSPKISYVGVALNKDHVLRWISHMTDVLWKCCEYLKDLEPKFANETKNIVLYLHVLVAFTSTNTWMVLKNKHMEKLRPGMNQLCANLMGQLCHKGFYIVLQELLLKGLGRVRIVFKNVSLTAILTLSLRPLIAANFSDKLMTIFLINILSVPGIIHHLQNLSPETILTLMNHKIFLKSLELLSGQQSMRIVFNALEGCNALYLLANLIQMAHIERNTTLREVCFPTFTIVITSLLESCQNYVVSKQSTLTHWHPVLGWFAQPVDTQLHAAMTHVITQLHLLWNNDIIQILLGEFLSELVQNSESIRYSPSSPTQNIFASSTFLKKVLESRSNRSIVQKSYRTLGSPDVHRIALTCSLYYTALYTLRQLQLGMLTGLCYQNSVLYDLWLFICSLGPNCGMKAFLDLTAFDTKCSAPEFKILQLFANCMEHYVTILDDVEMYEKQSPFKLSDFIVMSNFLNLFIYKAVVGNLLDKKTIHSNSLLSNLYDLLMLLYKRDCRRSYAPPGHWLIKEIKVSTFLSEVQKSRTVAQCLLKTMPHIIPHDDRVRLFRKYIANEKTSLGLTEPSCVSPHSTIITVHRNRIVEDGYRQLALLPPQALKAVIRVRFINEQGLDEAGIDQDGVFKEFLEETIKRVFDPSLNLFRTTSEERLYPSSTSCLHDNHLQLFEFIGRMLGKAVYEGIVIDVPFASFFLSQISGQSQILYSSLDELPSLDPELYRSLSYIKHYEGDVSDLDLTFSVDEDNMGKIVTHELTPGGKAVQVTNENKINYIHMMAHFRMHVQIKDQTAAFIRGFRAIINPEWLNLFSTPELQRLISGDNVPLDLKDLRRNCQYYGGFHDSHRVIGWLWDILEKDFSEEEKRMFLKFVTSCSKPPLLGFSHLEPPFSIRCVEVGDDEDTGDTIGSVFRGFFTIRKKDPQSRLPTSSTCFNLLKLPNYQKKSTLREKLRYAITCNTGFELS